MLTTSMGGGVAHCGRTTVLASQSQPPALVLNEPSCYQFRALDPRVFAILSATLAAVTIGHCYHN
jgi:hypothetical protein